MVYYSHYLRTLHPLIQRPVGQKKFHQKYKIVRQLEKGKSDAVHRLLLLSKLVVSPAPFLPRSVVIVVPVASTAWFLPLLSSLVAAALLLRHTLVPFNLPLTALLLLLLLSLQLFRTITLKESVEQGVN